MNFYASYTYNGGTVYAQYEGQTQDQIASMISDMGATNLMFIDQSVYAAAIAAQQPKLGA